MNTRPKRLVIGIKDIALITGKGSFAAKHLLEKIRKKLGKPEDGLVSIYEFCQHTGLNVEDVNRFL